jgi:hypothetical protein
MSVFKHLWLEKRVDIAMTAEGASEKHHENRTPHVCFSWWIPGDSVDAQLLADKTS